MESKWKVNGSGDSNKQVLTSVSVNSGDGFSIQVEDCGSPGRDSSNPRTPCSELSEHCSADDKRSHLPTSVGFLSSLMGADIERLSGSSMTNESSAGKLLTGQVKGVTSNSIENAPDSVGRSLLKSGNHVAVKMNDSNVSFDFRLGNSQDHLEIHLETGDDDGLSGTNTSRGRSSSEVISLLSSPERESVEHAEERRKSLISAATAADVPRFKWGDLDDEELEHMEQMEHMEEVLLSGPNGLSETPVLSSLTPDNVMDSQQNMEIEKQAEDGGQGSTGLALLAHSGSIGLAQDAAPGNTLGDLSCAKETKVVPKPHAAGKELGGKSDPSFDDHVLGPTDASSLACYYSKQIDHDVGAQDNPPLKSSYYRNSAAEALASAKSVVEVAALRDTTATATRNEVGMKKVSIQKHKSLAKGSHNSDAMALVAVLSKATCESPKAAIDFERESMSTNSEEVGKDWSVDPSKSIKNRMIARSDDKDGKDWFQQRLWCYLFENLNRSIDELYFLCDLQGDVDQMKEAILVLDEAGIDFIELKSRVDGVAKVKKAPVLPSPQSSASSRSSVSGVVEKQQRRPHAIAWEVRHLTTSEPQADSKGGEGEAFKQAQRADQASESQERRVSDPVRESDKHTAARQSSLVQVTRSECGSPIDKEMWKTGGASVESDSSPKKRKLSKKAAQDQMTGRLMRPTESSNIRVAFTTRDKEKEREKEREKDIRDQCWSIGSKNAVEAWKEKRNWVDILATPRGPAQSNRSQASYRKHAKHVQVLDDEPRSQEVKKTLGSDLLEVEKQGRSATTRMHLDVERVYQMQRDSEKQHHEDEWQSVRSNRIREGLGRHQRRVESRQGSYCDQRANIGSGRVSVTSSQHEEDKKVCFQQNHNSDIQRTEKMKTEQRQDLAREEAAQERLRVLEAQKKKRLADAQRRKQELKARREEDLKYSVTNRKDRIIEQVHKRVARASSQEQESEVLEQKLAERLRESAQRRVDHLDLIKECVTTEPQNLRSHNRSGSPGSLLEGSPLTRPFKTRERTNFVQINEAGLTTLMDSSESSTLHKQAMKKRLKKICQKLASKKQDFHEPPLGEALGMGTATVAGLARFKIGRWMDELRCLQQAKDYGKSLSISALITEIVKCLELKEPELHAARQQGLLEYAAVSIPIPYRTSEVTLGLLRIQRVLLCLPANRSYFIARNLLPPMIPMLSSSLEIFSTYGDLFQKVGEEAAGTSPRRKGSESSQEKLREEELETLQEVLEGLLSSATSIMGHTCNDDYQLSVQDDLADLIVVCEVIHRLRNLFAVFHWPRREQGPIPDPIVSGLKLLETMTGSKRKSLLAAHEEPINIVVHAASVSQAELSNKDQDDQPSNRKDSLKEGGIPMLAALGTDSREERNKLEREQSVEMEKRTKSLEAVPRIVITQKESTLARSTTFLVAAIAETELVGLPSLLSAVVLQAEPRHSAEQVACGLPSNFDEVATIVLRILNNVARLDLSLAQNKLALPDVGLEFYYLVSFLLTHCTCKWKTSNDEIAALLLETLLLLGYAALLHPGNQAILRWGKSPTILHKMCDLPFAFFSDPKLTPILIGTLLAVCYGSEINRDVVQQELSMDMLLAFLKSLKMGLIQPPVSESNNVKLDKKEAPKKAKSRVTHGIPNPDLDITTSRVCPRQKVPLPKAFVTPSRGRVTPISARGGFYSTGPSTPREARSGNATFRSTSRCSMSSPTPDLPPLPTRKAMREPSSMPSPKMSCRSVDTRDGEESVTVESLPTAFALRNRFPEGLWTFAEEFFSSGSWMGQIVKCL